MRKTYFLPRILINKNNKNMEEENKITIKEIQDFVGQHLATKPEVFWKQIDTFDRKEAFVMGMIEGIVNALVNGGVEVTGLKDFNELGKKIAKMIAKL